MANPQDNPNDYAYVVWVVSQIDEWEPFMFDDLDEAIQFTIGNGSRTVLTKVAEWAVSFDAGKAV